MPARNFGGVRFLFLNHVAKGGVLFGTGDVDGTGRTMKGGETGMYTCC